MVVDYYTDANGEVIKEFLKKNPIELKKMEKVASEDGEWPPYDNLTREAFADPETKMFPIFSKTAAQISALYVKAQSDQIPMHVKERVQEACNLFDLDEDVIGFKKVAQITPSLSEDDFIFPEIRKLPAVDRETFDLAQDAFVKVANELDFDDVVVGSRRLIKKAYELGIDDVDPVIEKLALLNAHIDKEALAKEAHERFISVADDRYLTIQKVASEIPTDEVHFLLKEMIAIDRENGIDKTAELIQKVATYNKDDIISIGGSDIPVEKIAGIPEDEWKEVLPYKEIDMFISENGFDKEAFEKLYHSLTPVEQDIIESFIQKNL